MSLPASKKAESVFQLTGIAALSLGMAVLAALLVDIVVDGWPRLRSEFLTSYPSRFAERAGIASALAGSFGLMILTALFSLPLGVGAAIYLEEYSKKGWLARLIEVNIANLAGIPSIIYGILGLGIFVRGLGLGRSILAGSLTMSLLILPVIIMASREAIRRVPDSIRQAAFALGASKWQVVRDHVLPVALPGIMTGAILGFSRAIGETAPLITMGALTYVAFLPTSISSPFTVLPIQAFNWISRPQAAFHQNAAAAICVLLAVLLMLNIAAVIIRAKFEKRLDF
jgi:phosphate transport system permease protein